MTHRSRRLAVTLVALSLLSSACGRAQKDAPSPHAATVPAVTQGQVGSGKEEQAGARKVVRRAELRLQAEDVGAAQRSAATVAERWGGFVMSTDARNEGGDADDRSSVTMVLRVPSDRFGAALEDLRRLGVRVDQEKISGEDVTDQYVDLEGRLRVQRALEDRLLAVLASARTVKDTLDVEKQLAEVRGTIEQLEGRRRVLADQSSLATFTVTFARRMPIAAAASVGLGDTFRQAASDSVSIFWALLRGGVRLVGFLLPFALLFAPPAYIAARIARKRRLAR